MAPKRAAEDDTEPKAPKSKRHRMTRTDPISGQRGAFGDLGDATTAPTGDSDLDCEDDSEALAYLRSVRTQASTIPHVLAAKKAGPSLPPQAFEGSDEDGDTRHADRTIYEDGVGDFRGYYEDGAYVACPEEEDVESYDEEDEGGKPDEAESGDELDTPGSTSDRPRNSSADEIRDAYFASITSRYLALRKRLQTNPPPSALDALPATNPTEVGVWKRGADTFQKWEGRLRGTDPLPAQVAAMRKDGVFRLLRVLLARRFLRTGTKLHERTSRWVWALLARLPDKGELDYMEVGWIRELGKRAVLMMVSLAELEVLREHCDVAGSSSEGRDEYEVDADVDDCFSDTLSQGIPIDAANAPTPESMEEPMDNTLNTDTSVTSNCVRRVPRVSANTRSKPNNALPHTIDIDDTSDVEMQLDSDTEDGEVAIEPHSPRSDPVTDIETAKARLLAQLGGDTADDGELGDNHISAPAIPVTQIASATHVTKVESLVSQTSLMSATDSEQEQGEYEPDEDLDDVDHKRYPAPDRDQVNERATLNMILTVAGEFYGQRDLLEFRDPFGGL